MARYVNDISTSKSETEQQEIIESFMKKEGFLKHRYKGEDVWKKGVGLLMAPQFIKTETGSGNVHIEAWIKYALLPGVYVGEMGTSGFFAIIPKGVLKKRVISLETALSS
jgi:hypothetical protein